MTDFTNIPHPCGCNNYTALLQHPHPHTHSSRLHTYPIILNMASESYDLVITNGIVVTADEIREVDVAITGETIAAIKERGAFQEAQVAKFIDAKGGWVMPGGIVGRPTLFFPPDNIVPTLTFSFAGRSCA